MKFQIVPTDDLETYAFAQAESVTRSIRFPTYLVFVFLTPFALRARFVIIALRTNCTRRHGAHQPFPKEYAALVYVAHYHCYNPVAT